MDTQWITYLTGSVAGLASLTTAASLVAGTRKRSRRTRLVTIGGGILATLAYIVMAINISMHDPAMSRYDSGPPNRIRSASTPVPARHRSMPRPRSQSYSLKANGWLHV